MKVLLVTQVIKDCSYRACFLPSCDWLNNHDLMASQVNGPLYNIGAWTTAIVVTALSMLLILATLFPDLVRGER